MRAKVGHECNSRSRIEKVVNLPSAGSTQRPLLPEALIFVCVWVSALIYMWFYLKRGWVPHDEGTLAQSAERVLKGELPHRDFADGYSGGLSFLNAVAFRMLGVNLASLRILLFMFFAVWVPCVYYVATRFVSMVTAGAITLLAVVWSVPNYPAGMPSWYNLFFAVAAISALLRYMEVGSRRWLFLAGLGGGFSILVKITGLYFVFAAALFFIFYEQNLARVKNSKSLRNGWIVRTFIATGLILFLVSLTRLVNRIQGVRGIIYFVMPSLFVVALLLYREFERDRESDRDRFATMYPMVASFGAGVAIPILGFLIPYGLSHSTGALWHDIFDGSEKQLLFAATAAPPVLFMIPILPIALFITMILASHRQGQLVYGILLLIYLANILMLSSRYQLPYAHGWCSLAYSIPTITLAGVVAIGLPRRGRQLTDLQKQQIMLLVTATALMSLVQFPFSAPVYFCYVAPLTILSATALFATIEQPPRMALGTLIVFYLMFAVFRVTPGFSLGTLHHAIDLRTERLSLARAGELRVDPGDARLYEKLIPVIQVHADGKFTYAAPDCPEIYFLAGLQNPTRTFFDYRDDPIGRNERILRALESHGVNVVAIDTEPQFSGALAPDLMAALELRYPLSQDIGHFRVRWRVKQSQGTH
jgi:hypothetical protein